MEQFDADRPHTRQDLTAELLDVDRFDAVAREAAHPCRRTCVSAASVDGRSRFAQSRAVDLHRGRGEHGLERREERETVGARERLPHLGPCRVAARRVRDLMERPCHGRCASGCRGCRSCRRRGGGP